MKTDYATRRRTYRRTGFLAAGALAVFWAIPASVPAQAADEGEYTPRATLAEVMESIVMPSADVIWNAVAVNVTASGIEESKPETDDDWAKIRWAAVTLEEAMNLVLIPGRAIDKPGVVSEAPDVELGPEQIGKLIADNHPAWVGHARALQAVAQQAIAAVDARDVDQISDVGGAIDAACESCHTQFWYPNQ